jgi:hypothetical protein
VLSRRSGRPWRRLWRRRERGLTVLLILDTFVEVELPDLPIVEGRVKAGKGLHTLSVRDTIRQAVIDAGVDLNSGKYRAQRSRDTRSMQRKFDDLVKDVAFQISYTTQAYLRGRAPGSRSRVISKKEWLAHVRGNLKRGYYAAFEMGLYSSGVRKFGVVMSKDDRAYVEGAIRHELEYFDRLLGQIEAGTYKGRLSDRLAAYSDAMKHIYYAGRIMGTPSGHVVDWVSPLDRNTCKGCAFLSRHSPYVKDKLPTTPRAGDTACLDQCRCRLVVRRASPEEYDQVLKDPLSKARYREWLKAIKSGKVLP